MLQIINANTCEPEPDVFMDIWHCNATGVYSGVSASGNGNGDDDSSLDETFLRGIQKSDENVLTHNANNTTELANGTISGLLSTHPSHIGRLFFDQDLISQVESLSLYTTNTQKLTTNANDDILAGEAAAIDPFKEYVLLGEDVSDGISAWISVAIDPTADRELRPAAYYPSDGGFENENSAMGGGPGGSAPGGAAPSGTCAPMEM
ncbi:hypothetical protein CNMCM5623_007523 [Aspergillus felis]|uniref:Extracellular dioxygenase n=1 Tax=Aspergillus felis TaxID=1287682 RepID=A0A8H6PJH3_9EURO|nr:hypothetical protein CNMCM5623_007523 [Aspergillus felis]